MIAQQFWLPRPTTAVPYTRACSRRRGERKRGREGDKGQGREEEKEEGGVAYPEGMVLQTAATDLNSLRPHSSPGTLAVTRTAVSHEHLQLCVNGRQI